MKILFIDDEKEEYEKLQDLLRIGGIEDRIVVTYIHPFDLVGSDKNKNSEKIFETIDAVLVDYRLFNPNKEGKTSGLSGISIATNLRFHFSDIPIFLYSYREFARLAPIEEDVADAIFDEILYKDDFSRSGRYLFERLSIICEGYSKIREVDFSNALTSESNDRKQKLYDLLSAPDESYNDLDTLLIWIGRTPDNWTLFEIASMIRKRLMGEPGILYDLIHAATFLGISEDSYKVICKFFEGAKYSGVLSKQGDLWWKCKLMEIADSIMEGDELRIPHSHGFHTAWKRKTGSELELAKCIVSGETPAECVCHVLKKPVKIKYTLKYPTLAVISSAMDEKRVYFYAIMENKVDLKILDQDSLDIFNRYVKGLEKNGI